MKIALVCVALAVSLILTVVVIGATSTGEHAPSVESPNGGASGGIGSIHGTAFPFVPSLLVAQVISEVRQSDVYSYIGGLSGEWPVIVDGESYTIVSRNTYAEESLEMAVAYVGDFMQAQGLTVIYQEWTGEDEEENEIWGTNVIGVLTGTVRPDEIVLITAHLDDMPEGDVAPGADDNASGCAGVMMAAARLADYDFERTVRFVFFTAEEDGQVGSQAYVEEIQAGDEDVVAVYNMDMIGYDLNQDGALLLETRDIASAGYASDLAIADVFTQVVNAYGLRGVLDPYISASYDEAVDSRVFWDEGYPSVTATEDWDDDPNPYYHTKNDTLATLNLSYLTNCVKASVGTVAHLAIPVNQVYLPLTEN